MKESSVVHAYRSPLSPPSLPLPGSLVAPRYVAKEGGVSGGGCNGHVGAFLRASLARAMFCSDNPISHGRTRSLASPLCSPFRLRRSKLGFRAKLHAEGRSRLVGEPE